MKALILLLLLPILSFAQRPTYKGVIILTSIRFYDSVGQSFVPENVLRINFKNDSTVIVAHVDSTRDLYRLRIDTTNIELPVKDSFVYNYIPIFLPAFMQKLLNDSCTHINVNFEVKQK